MPDQEPIEMAIQWRQGYHNEDEPGELIAETQGKVMGTTWKTCTYTVDPIADAAEELWAKGCGEPYLAWTHLGFIRRVQP